jgi:hypothetical protein
MAPQPPEDLPFQVFRAFPSLSVADSVTWGMRPRHHDTLVNAASSVSAAQRCVFGVTWLEPVQRHADVGVLTRVKLQDIKRSDNSPSDGCQCRMCQNDATTLPPMSISLPEP